MTAVGLMNRPVAQTLSSLQILSSTKGRFSSIHEVEFIEFELKQTHTLIRVFSRCLAV